MDEKNKDTTHEMLRTGLRQAIKALEGEMTVFIVSQRTSSVRQADLILVLNDGRLVGQGTHRQLLEQKGMYWQLYTGAVELE